MISTKVNQNKCGNPNLKSGRTDSQQQHKHKQRKDKTGKGRRNGSRTSSSGGGSGGSDPKNLPVGNHNGSNKSLLEDYKAKKNNRDWTVYDAKGHVVEFCQDQNGSRFIQQRLEMGDAGEKDIVMAEVLPEVVRLRNDVFGNYVVQKLFGFGNKKMKEDLFETMVGEMVQLSMKTYW